MRQFFISFFFLLTGLTGCGRQPAPRSALPPHLRDGFVVWESNRTGAWRIFHKDLRRGKARQLSPDEPGRSHFAAHISPDGNFVVYLSYPEGADGYRRQPADQIIPMWILEKNKPKSARILIENARPYGEHRAAVWLSDSSLAYIDPAYQTRVLNLETGESERLIQGRPGGHLWDHGYLPDPSLRYATSGVANFGLLEGENNTFIPRTLYGGCQPFFTRDGRWAYWMSGMGGPLSRFDPVTEEISTLLRRDDPRMPDDRSYLYFPHISACSQLLVIAASPDQHDHNTSDYDLFLAPLNPATLELTGTPIRFTTHDATDRFPEIFLPPLDLGRHEGKAPLRLALPNGRYTLNGKKIEVKTGELTMDTPGTHLLESRQNGHRQRGLIQVLPAEPPRFLSGTLSRNGEITLRFNEPADPETAQFQFEDPSLAFEIRSDPESARIVLTPETDARPDTLTLTFEGVRDREQRNPTPSRTLTLQNNPWPISREGLVLAWESGSGVQERVEDDRITPLTLRARGRARKTAHQALRLDQGSFVVTETGAALAETFSHHDEFTLEAVVQARIPDQRGPARIVSLSDGPTSRNFTLGQEADHYVLRLRTANNAPNAVEPLAILAPVSTASPSHLLVTYRAGELTAYLDGTETARTAAFADNLGVWDPQTFVLGAETDGSRDWAGTLEGLAVYRRAFTPEEAARAARIARSRLDSRIPAPRSIVEARLTAATPVPTLDEISPYREIMIVHEYEVLRTLSGPELPQTVRVHHWGILDATPQALPAQQPGDTARLWLEPMASHPHLENTFPADTLELDLDTPLFLDVSL